MEIEDGEDGKNMQYTRHYTQAEHSVHSLKALLNQIKKTLQCEKQMIISQLT